MSISILLKSDTIPQALFDEEYIHGVESGWKEGHMALHGAMPRKHQGTVIWVNEGYLIEVENILRSEAIEFEVEPDDGVCGVCGGDSEPNTSLCRCCCW